MLCKRSRKRFKLSSSICLLAQAQLERSNRDVAQSIELQHLAVKRQAQVRNVAMPLIGVLVLLMVYLLVKGGVFF